LSDPALSHGVLEERLALLGREQRSLLAHRLVDHADHHAVEDTRSPPDDVQVAVGDRVVGARADGDAAVAHAPPPVWMRMRVSP
jgi:hypothetical protein